MEKWRDWDGIEIGEHGAEHMRGQWELRGASFRHGFEYASWNAGRVEARFGVSDSLAGKQGHWFPMIN